MAKNVPSAPHLPAKQQRSAEQQAPQRWRQAGRARWQRRCGVARQYVTRLVPAGRHAPGVCAVWRGVTR